MLSQKDKDILIHLEKYKVITIKQCQRIFFNDADKKLGYDYARKKLKQLEDKELIKSYQNSITEEKVYYVQDKISAHDIFKLDFYSKLCEFNCKNIEVNLYPSYLKDLIRPDAFFKFVRENDYTHEDELHLILLEVDLTHFTSLTKFKMYEKLYKEEEIQNQYYGIFPEIVVIGVNTIKYQPLHKIQIEYLDFNLSNFNIIL